MPSDQSSLAGEIRARAPIQLDVVTVPKQAVTESGQALPNAKEVTAFATWQTKNKATQDI